jgi:hypothetical protein
MTTTRRRLKPPIVDRLRTRLQRMRAVLRELDYAQRRLLEIRTGYVFTPEERARRTRAEIRSLEHLLDAEPSERPPDSVKRPA